MLNTFIFSPSAPHFPLSFYGSFVSPSFLLPPYPQLFVARALSFTPSPRILSRCKAPPTWTLPAPPPASLRHSSLCPAPHACVSRRFLCRFVSPFVSFGLNPGPCKTLGGLPVAGPSAPLCSCLALPEVSSKSWHRPVLGISSGGFSHAGERPGHLHSLAVMRPGPCSPATWHGQLAGGGKDQGVRLPGSGGALASRIFAKIH